MAEKLRNTQFHIVLDTEFDAFGIEGGFTMEIQDLAGNALTNDDPAGDDFVEVLKDAANVTAVNGTVASDAAAGAKTVQLNAGHTATPGAVIQFGTSDIRAIRSVDGNTITLVSPLSATITSGTTISAKPNTGIYKCPVVLDFVGQALFLISHPEYGSLTIRYDMVNQSMDTLGTKIDGISEAVGAAKTIKAIL